MPALFPNSVRIFSTKVDLTDTVLAEHVNLLQDEVTAVETTLGTGLLSSSWTGSYTNPSAHASLTARLTNIEAGLKNLETTKLGSSSNAATASAWQTARTLTLTGAVSGSATIDGTANVTLNTTSDATLRTTLTAKGDLYVASAASTPARLGVGANNSVPVADSAETVGIRWTTTLAGLTLTSPAISSISNGGTLTLPSGTDTLVGRATTDTLTNKTLTLAALNRPVVTSPTETVNVVAASANGTVQFDAATATVQYFTTNASGNWTLNVRGNSGTTLNSMLAVGQSITVVFLVPQGTTAYLHNAMTIDGTSVAPRWQGGSAPTSGNPSSVDAYSFTITKTAATPTYLVLGSITRYA